MFLFYIIASKEGQIGIVRLLIDYGVALDTKDNIGNTPLLYAGINCIIILLNPILLLLLLLLLL
jgi:hypothetical protein